MSIHRCGVGVAEELPARSEGSPTSAFDFDDDSIADLLDSFIAKQTGDQSVPASRAPDPNDAGAQAAQRTIFQHGPRDSIGIPGQSAVAQRRRIALLGSLANGATGSARARLLTTLGELQERRGDLEAALRAYGQAVEADARDVVALRAIRRHALQREDWEAACAALTKEAALGLPRAEQASALKLLAQIHLRRTGDTAAAERAAERACDALPGDFGASLLLASVRIARGDLPRAGVAVAMAAATWPEPTAQSRLLQHAGGLMEQGGQIDKATALYRRASELDPSSLTARLSLARAARELGDEPSCVEALQTAAAEHASPQVREALSRAAAVMLADEPVEAKAAIGLLASSQTYLSRLTAAEIVLRAGDVSGAVDILAIGTVDAGPEAIELTRARLARLRAELAGPGGTLTVSLVPSPPTSEANDTRTAPWAAYLHASRRLVEDEGEDRELAHVLESMQIAPESLVADIRGTDRAASRGDRAACCAALEREVDRAPGRPGPVLALAEAAQGSGILDRAEALERGHRLREPLLDRARATHERSDPRAAAGRWLAEATATSGPRAAFACMMAARLLRRAGLGTTDALYRAIEQVDNYRPALWELEDGNSAPSDRMWSATRQADLGGSEAAEAQLRGSLWAEEDADRFAHALSAADTSLDALVIEHLVAAAGVHGQSGGDLLARVGKALESPEYLERAAAAFRGAGLSARAAKTLRDALALTPRNAAMQVACEDAELQASEFARVAEAQMRRVREALEPAGALGALSSMAAVDRLARGDMLSARLSLQSIAESRPEHLPTARALEWDALREDDGERVLSSARRLIGALPAGSRARVARHRLILEALRADPNVVPTDLDRILRGIGPDLRLDLGLARQVLGMAYARGDAEVALEALNVLRAELGTELEQSALALEQARILEGLGRPEDAIAALAEATAHPLALEVEAILLQHAGRWEEATKTYRKAAEQAKDSRRAASLWRAAAGILEEEIADPERAIEAYVAATQADITYLDVYRRLLALYHRQGLLDEAELLIEARIEAGADTPTLVALLLEQADQRRARGRLDASIDSLHDCLELDPHHFPALHALVEVSRAHADWRGAAAALVRIASLRRSVDEEVWAFTELGAIYHERLEDLPRAEAALRQAFQRAPARSETLDRLATILSSRGNATEAARVLQELVRRESGDEESRDYRIRLAAAIESAGQPRQAEVSLEQLRAERPTDLDVVFALADHFDRQGAEQATAMHLNRALVDLRESIDHRPEDETLWTRMVRVLERRHGPGPASCAASAAIAVGHAPALFAGATTEHDGAIGTPRSPLSAVVDRVVAPRELPATLVRLFTLCENAFDKHLPFDTGAWKLKRPSGTQRTLVEEARLVAKALGLEEPKLRMTVASPIACMPIAGSPPTLVLGGSLLERTTREERAFLFARALKVAASHLSPALRARPEQLDAALGALLGDHGGRSIPPETSVLRRKLLGAIPRRWRDETESLVIEVRGDAHFSSARVPSAIAALGNRVALTLTGDVPSALQALLKVAGQEVPGTNSARMAAIRQSPEVWSMVQFAISDAHFEARTQAGVDP